MPDPGLWAAWGQERWRPEFFPWALKGNIALPTLWFWPHEIYFGLLTSKTVG
jgi:hypothetical protein